MKAPYVARYQPYTPPVKNPAIAEKGVALFKKLCTKSGQSPTCQEFDHYSFMAHVAYKIYNKHL